MAEWRARRSDRRAPIPCGGRRVVGFGNVSAADGGAFNAHAFLWTRDDGIRDLGTLPGDSLVKHSASTARPRWSGSPEFVILYNDATRPMMGERHPASLGHPLFEQWPETEVHLGPLLRAVMATGTGIMTRNGLVPIERDGFLQELYFTWSYNPVRVESGGIGGVFQIATEVTEEILGGRRQRVLRNLAALPTVTRTTEQVCESAARLLPEGDLPFALLYLLDDRPVARLVATAGLAAGLPQSPLEIELSASATWPFADLGAGRELLVNDLSARFGPQAARGWPVAPSSALVLPLAGPQEERPLGFLVAGLSSGLPLDESYRSFLAQVAGLIAAAVAQVRAAQAAEENARLEATLRGADEIRRTDLRLLFEAAPIGVALMRGPTHVYEFSNAAYLAMCGYRDIIGKPVREAFSETVVGQFLPLLDRVYRTGEVVTAREIAAQRYETPTGSPVDCFVTFSYSPFRTAEGKNDGVVVVVSDVTEMVHARVRLEALAAQLRLADRRKDEFLAMLGHELRNPLAPIATAVELMKLRDGDKFSRERDIIDRQTQHMSRLVSDLLDVSRIAQGKIQLERGVVELAHVVGLAVETASPLFEKRRQHLAVEVPQSGLLVDGDRGRLAQVVSNLLSNASKFTPVEGHVRVSAAGEGNDVVLHVTDEGMGIDPVLLPEIFELFVQSPRTLDRTEGGLGLGLALVRSLLALHGGSVSASSAGKGKGADFAVRLPQASRLARPVLASPSSSRGRSRSVLVVDDNQDAADLLAELLRSVGHVVEVAYDGAQALRLLGERAFDVGVLDIGLPVMDGYEVARRIRGLPSSHACHLIAVTGYGEDSDRRRGAAAGFDAFFAKPVSLKELMSEIGVRR